MKPENLNSDKALLVDGVGEAVKTLRLTLKKKWFDMILSGEKKEEYREVKMYWAKRLMNGFPEIHGIEKLNPDFKTFEHIEFRHGYAKKAPTIIIQCNGIEIGKTRVEWSDEDGKESFVLKLGKILETKHCANCLLVDEF